MVFYADLHIHSKYSRATSRDLDLEHISLWARKKGVTVVGTGDFTHPEWFRELQEKLVPSEPGLFRLRPDLEQLVEKWLGAPAGEPTRFLLEVEISTIYKKDDKTRKVHHLLYAPDLAKAGKIRDSLGRIGNIASDGRPILGLDSRDLLEITLEGGDGCFLIPAHIWTPWFAALGSKSGFDSIEHCYGDLTSEIFAVETGLSSDPPMNWRLSQLDRYTLVSNSDAHSPAKIGREACVFDTELSYFAMRAALENRSGYGGTVEFFPEEGKYHMDGHRKCGVKTTPEETQRTSGVCEVCGKPLTLGVMHRVSELADRTEPEPPATAAPFRSFIPLEEVIAEIEGVGPKSKRVQARYEDLLKRHGSELFLLEDAQLADVDRQGAPLLAEALGRMRRGEVRCDAGYDGEYGTIRVFERRELERRQQGALLFDVPEMPAPKPSAARNPLPTDDSQESSAGAQSVVATSNADDASSSSVTVDREMDDALAGLDPDQRAAAAITSGPLLIIAGPGTGKTRTLTRRLAYLVENQGVEPEECLAITFTRRAAQEMRERLEVLLGDRCRAMQIVTFHRLGLSIVTEQLERLGRDAIRVLGEAEREAIVAEVFDVALGRAPRFVERIGATKLGRTDIDGVTAAELKTYESVLRDRGAIDFDDLIALPLKLFDGDGELAAEYRRRYRHVAVDEYQDVDAAQYRLLRHLVAEDGNLCAIGDPDQAIYGFRGADVSYFQRFTSDFCDAQTVALTRNYRSTPAIVSAAAQVVAPSTLVEGRELHSQSVHAARVEVHTSASDKAEAEFVVHTIERALGGSSFFSLDSGRVEASSGGDDESLAFGDFAVLYRTEAQATVLIEALARSGMPFQRRSHHRLGDVACVQIVADALTKEDWTPRASVRKRVDKICASLLSADPEIELYRSQLQEVAERAGGDREAFLADIALGVDADLWDPRAESVSLLTMHAAKGLEFPVVFVVGCEDGIMPLTFGGEAPSEGEMAEERRLFFVAMTRAERRLILSHARKRFWRGKVREQSASPFLADIEHGLLERALSSGKPRKASSPFTQLSLFD